MDELTEKKKQFRARARALRDGIAPEKAKLWSRQICDRILHWDIYLQAGILLAYYPTGSEADIRPVLKDAIARGKITGLPRVEGQRAMEFYRICGLHQLCTGAMGLSQPAAGCPPVELLQDSLGGGPPVLMLIPGLAFAVSDEQPGPSGVSRIGYGGGFYDTWLHRHRYRACNRPWLTCGAAFDQLLFKGPQLPTEPHDCFLDAIVTESRLQIYRNHKPSGPGDRPEQSIR